MGSEDRESRNLVEKDQYDLSMRRRSKSNESHLIVRTTSDPDLYNRGRSRSNVSQCSRSRSQTKTQISVDELLMDTQLLTPRKFSLVKGPRPNPDGMASTANGTVPSEVAIRVETPGNLNPLKGFVAEEGRNSNQNHPRTADEVVERRRALQKQKEAAFLKLRAELERAHHELRKRDEECKKLSSVRDDLDREVEELTASLFEEAHKMVTEAKVKQASAEMQLKEAKMKMDGLEAEVAALKVLVITSTPSNPGKKAHRRAPSAGQICTDCETYHCHSDGPKDDDDLAVIDSPNEKEVDRIAHREFTSWLEKRCPMNSNQFLDTIEKHDVMPCLHFPNQELASEVFNAIKENLLVIEPVSGTNKSRRCVLTKASISCSYRFRIGESGKWNYISNGCRARIIAVADLYTFLRYIQQGLIRKEGMEMFVMNCT